MLEFIRIGCAVPQVKVADTLHNADQISRLIALADEEKTDVLVFPRLALTGCTCQDLFFQQTLMDGVKEGIRAVASASREHPGVCAVVGLPMQVGGKLYDCAGVFCGGFLVGLVPRGQADRWFASGKELENVLLRPQDVGLTAGQTQGGVPVGCHQMFRLPGGALLGVEVDSELMHPVAPSSVLALQGAEVIVNCASCVDLVGNVTKYEERAAQQSGLCHAVYALSSAGPTESTSDMVYAGNAVIAQGGDVLARGRQQLLLTDCDLGTIRTDRRRDGSFTPVFSQDAYDILDMEGEDTRSDGSLYPVRKLPFIPDTEEKRLQRCREIFQIQVEGLKQRLGTLNTNAVLGISGGLDSTLALLVAVEAMRQLGRPASHVYAVTMPCFGTSDRTYNNAWELMRKLGVTAKEISIKSAVEGHFRDIGHDSSVHNGTYENSQARERTQILMDYASVVGGLVVGTGDLSELALGWCTFNGDHMSMYGVNGGVPKSMIRWIVEAVSQSGPFQAARQVLMDVLDTPISPELLPPDAQGKIAQQTEDIVGPYALHDFFLYYVLRYGFSPAKIYHLACMAFSEEFAPQVVKKWLAVFYRRFFSQQFKRNCQPDGVKIGTVGVGPRGDLCMPSEASCRLWLREAELLSL